MGGCVWGVDGMRVGRGRDACTGLGKFAPLKRSDLGKSEREVQICPKSASFTRPPVRPPRHRHRPRTGRQLQTADCAPPAHLLPQYCTLLGKTRPRHRPRTGRRLQTVPPRTLPLRRCQFAPPARPIRHRQFAPPAHPTRYYQSTRPGVLPANSETPRPPKW